MTDERVPVDEFAARARSWLAGQMPAADPAAGHFFFGDPTGRTDSDDLARIDRCRELQRRLFDGGFAGICVPTEYGGQGLTPAHQFAFNRELRGYDYPLEIQASTFIPCMAVLLEFGTEEQKRRHVPAMLRGEEVWAQFLSEPGGGSDAAGAVTTATRDGDQWVLNGSKIWTTGAWYSDWALCLARTNWDVEKHRGLTVFSLPVRSPGVEVHRIQLLNGSKEFCQEFLTDVVVDDRDRVGDVDAGWTVMTRWLHHERTIAGGSPYVTTAGSRGEGATNDGRDLAELARELGSIGDPRTLERIGEARALTLVGDALVRSVTGKMQAGALPHHAAAVLRLFSGTANVRKAALALEVAAGAGVVWGPGEARRAQAGTSYLVRQASCIGGGTTEMARNVISERLLGMPRDSRADAGPFRDVPRGPQ
ncbi:MAG TPA: acyl-CoA dehydrogenase family protein [Acidimicrobiales bacterium]|nr:acyl-CoA dehydrogenase family protein [Acidimicrobiales bacterium]